MKITIDIDEQEIAKEVKELVLKNAVEEVEHYIYGGKGYYNRDIYIDSIKAAVRETVKKHAEDIINRAVDAGGLYIGKKGLKKMIDEDAI